MKKTFGVVGMVSLILLVGFGVAVALGYAYVGVKKPQQGVAVAGNVCDQKIIDKFNDNYNEIADDEMTIVYKDVTSRAGYRDDPTCQYMVTEYMIAKADKPAAEKSLKELKALVAAGSYPNPALDRIAPMSELEFNVSLIGKVFEGSDAPQG